MHDPIARTYLSLGGVERLRPRSPKFPRAGRRPVLALAPGPDVPRRVGARDRRAVPVPACAGRPGRRQRPPARVDHGRARARAAARRRGRRLRPRGLASSPCSSPRMSDVPPDCSHRSGGAGAPLPPRAAPDAPPRRAGRRGRLSTAGGARWPAGSARAARAPRRSSGSGRASPCPWAAGLVARPVERVDDRDLALELAAGADLAARRRRVLPDVLAVDEEERAHPRRRRADRLADQDAEQVVDLVVAARRGRGVALARRTSSRARRRSSRWARVRRGAAVLAAAAASGAGVGVAAEAVGTTSSLPAQTTIVAATTPTASTAAVPSSPRTRPVQRATGEAGPHRPSRRRGARAGARCSTPACAAARGDPRPSGAGGDRPPAGGASTARFEILTSLQLVHQLDVGGTASYFEPADCRRRPVASPRDLRRLCGKRDAFADPKLEKVIDTLAERLGSRSAPTTWSCTDAVRTAPEHRLPTRRRR